MQLGRMGGHFLRYKSSCNFTTELIFYFSPPPSWVLGTDFHFTQCPPFCMVHPGCARLYLFPRQWVCGVSDGGFWSFHPHWPVLRTSSSPAVGPHSTGDTVLFLHVPEPDFPGLPAHHLCSLVSSLEKYFPIETHLSFLFQSRSAWEWGGEVMSRKTPFPEHADSHLFCFVLYYGIFHIKKK